MLMRPMMFAFLRRNCPCMGRRSGHNRMTTTGSQTLNRHSSQPDPDSSPTVTDTRMSDEIVHNLDGCEISLVGDDLDPERESLLLDMASLQQRGLELTNTSAYLTIAGQ